MVSVNWDQSWQLHVISCRLCYNTLTKVLTFLLYFFFYNFSPISQNKCRQIIAPVAPMNRLSQLVLRLTRNQFQHGVSLRTFAFNSTRSMPSILQFSSHYTTYLCSCVLRYKRDFIQKRPGKLRSSPGCTITSGTRWRRIKRWRSRWRSSGMKRRSWSRAKRSRPLDKNSKVLRKKRAKVCWSLSRRFITNFPFFHLIYIIRKDGWNCN